jgi:putative ABC transport system permease protein
VADLPGVASASAVLSAPLSGSSANFSFVIEGRPEPAPGEDYAAGFQSVSSGYFRTMGIPLLDGRDFNERDAADAPKVAVISQALAGRNWPGEDPIGSRISLDDEEWIEIVGVAGNVLHSGLDREPRPEIYLPYQQAAIRFMTLVVKSKSEPMALVGAVRSQVFAVDPDLPVYKVMSLNEIVAESVARPRFNMYLLGIFSAVALVLAAIGIYGLMSFSVSQRTHEIGIRLAMGAGSGDVFKLVVGEGMALALAGLALGLAVAWAVTRLLSSLLFGVTTTDPVTFAGVSFVLAAVALVAVYIPARRATRVDPLVALRYE